MPKTGEDWIRSPERRRLETGLVVAGLPVTGPAAISARIAIALSQGRSNVVVGVDRALHPGETFRLNKFGNPEDNSRVLQLSRMAMVDELPQVAAILRGSMSLIGPRPDKPEHIERLFAAIEDDDLRQRWLEARSLQKPGIISSYALYSHSTNLEGATEAARFAGEEVIARNAAQRAEMDVMDFDLASLGHDIRLLAATGVMAARNYATYMGIMGNPNHAGQNGSQPEI